MKLTLRKAHRLVKDLQSKLGVKNIAQIVHHSADDAEVLVTIDKVEQLNKESVEQSLLVAEAISTIRAGVQVLNSRDVDGDTIDSLLNEKVLVESKMKVLSGFATPTINTQERRVLAIQRQVQDAAKNSGTGYHSTDVTVQGQSIAAHTAFNEQYIELKKEQERISDKLAYINNALHVEVDDKFLELFKALQVL